MHCGESHGCSFLLVSLSSRSEGPSNSIILGRGHTSLQVRATALEKSQYNYLDEFKALLGRGTNIHTECVRGIQMRANRKSTSARLRQRQQTILLLQTISAAASRQPLARSRAERKPAAATAG